MQEVMDSSVYRHKQRIINVFEHEQNLQKDQDKSKKHNLRCNIVVNVVRERTRRVEA